MGRERVPAPDGMRTAVQRWGARREAAPHPARRTASGCKAANSPKTVIWPLVSVRAHSHVHLPKCQKRVHQHTHVYTHDTELTSCSAPHVDARPWCTPHGTGPWAHMLTHDTHVTHMCRHTNTNTGVRALTHMHTDHTRTLTRSGAPGGRIGRAFTHIYQRPGDF